MIDKSNYTKSNDAGFAPLGAIIAGLVAIGAIGAGALYQYKYSTQVRYQQNQGNKVMGDHQVFAPTKAKMQGVSHKNMSPDEFKQNHIEKLAQFSVSNLSEQEKETLLFMHEEEKMARDIYKKFYEIWGDQVFDKIAQSENRHFMATQLLLERYDIADPVADIADGVFANTEIQSLYNSLLEKGSKSLRDALEVGAMIEDVDIKDLQEAIAETDNEDIKYVYTNLMRASRNHLREFYPKLADLGVEYKAQYISQEELEQIINSPKERGENASAHGAGFERGMHGRDSYQMNQGRGYGRGGAQGGCDHGQTGEQNGQCGGYGQGRMQGQGYGQMQGYGQGRGHSNGQGQGRGMSW